MSSGSAPAPRPFHDLRAGYLAQRTEILAAIERVLDSGRYVLGPEVEAFEREFAASVGAERAVGVSNGTDALAIALRCAGVAPGDHVAIPALTAIPTAMAVKQIGARPLLVDVDDATLTMDPAGLEAALTSRPRAIVPVHLYGQCAAMDAIGAIARSRGVPVVEDAAQAHGARLDAKAAGSFGRLGCFSFYPTKNLGTFGDGGAIVTGDAELAARAKRLRFYGQVEGYDCVEAGQNARLDEVHAAILRVRLAALDVGNEIRRAIAERYRAEIRNPAIRLPDEAPGRRHVWHQFVVRCARRDLLRAHLLRHGIETLIHYPRALSRMSALAEDAKRSPPSPVAERAASEVLSLPIHPEVPEAVIAATIAAANSFA